MFTNGEVFKGVFFLAATIAIAMMISSVFSDAAQTNAHLAQQSAALSAVAAQQNR